MIFFRNNPAFLKNQRNQIHQFFMTLVRLRKLLDSAKIKVSNFLKYRKTNRLVYKAVNGKTLLNLIQFEFFMNENGFLLSITNLLSS